jgi:hypothetical protein
MGNTDVEAEINGLDEGTQGPAEGTQQEGSAGRGLLSGLRIFKHLEGRGRATVFVLSAFSLAVLLIWGGLSLFSSPEKPAGRQAVDLKLLPRKADPSIKGSLVKEKMQPFYIELDRTEAGKMARLSFAVTCDFPSSKRLTENRVLVRDRLYSRLIELASEGKDIRRMSVVIRTEAQKILEEILRPKKLHVVVTGIFIV